MNFPASQGPEWASVHIFPAVHTIVDSSTGGQVVLVAQAIFATGNRDWKRFQNISYSYGIVSMIF